VERIGSRGRVVGIDAAPAMVAMARERVARHRWRNVEVIESPVADATIPVRADAALFCAVHDILQSPAGLRRVVESLRPGAAVAAGGGKWASPWMVALNVQVLLLHAPYVENFGRFDRPWTHLEALVDGFRVRELAFGTGYVAAGHTPLRGCSRS
jgi:SAM-dependent methyltransferase